MKSRLGHYELVAELGRGGMGVVYKALDPALGRVVAIKELAPALADDPALVERFLREARSMAALSDPHIVNIHFIGQEDGRPFFVMEFVDGESLSALLRRLGRLGVADALKLCHQTARGLATAHEHGVVHRDIKPGNLLVDTRGRLRIADFGIALPTRDPSQKLTGTGEFVGTPGYVSPEICKGQPVDQRSDIFSLGVVLFEMLSGRMPFTDVSPLGLMLEVVNAQLPDIQSLNDEVDADLSAILARMVAKEPAERYQHAGELAAALAVHPLVADGRPLALVVQPPRDSDTAARALQQPRVPTPPPVVAAAATAPRGSRPSAASAEATVARRTAPASGVLARDRRMALAAALLLVLGGSAYAFRDYLSGFANGFRDGFVAGKVSNPVPPSLAADSATPAAGAVPAPANGSVAGAGDPGHGGGTDSATSAAASATLDPPPSATPFETAGPAGSEAPVHAPDTAIADAGIPDAAADSGMATDGSTNTTNTTATAATAATSAAQPSAATGTAPTLAARARPAPAPAPVPARALVVWLGDPALARPAQHRIEQYLRGAGHQLADADTLAGVAGNGDIAAVLAAAARHARVLVVVRADPVGSRELYFHGRRDIAHTADLAVRVYDTGSGQVLPGGFSSRVEFAALNAAIRANAALDPELASLERALAPRMRPVTRG